MLNHQRMRYIKIKLWIVSINLDRTLYFVVSDNFSLSEILDDKKYDFSLAMKKIYNQHVSRDDIQIIAASFTNDIYDAIFPEDILEKCPDFS